VALLVVGPINALLVAPTTTYTVEACSPDGLTVPYRWLLVADPEEGCGTFTPIDAATQVETITGAAAGTGTYEGRARVILTPDDYHASRRAMIGVIVTDHGGALSHAAIVAREFGIPAVVETVSATQLITDGERVVVDAETGTVERVA